MTLSWRDAAALAARRCLARGRAWTGAHRRAFRLGVGSTPVLMYHRVLADRAPTDGIEPGMYVRAATFDRQLSWLRQRFTPIGLSQALDHRGAPEAIAVLTFDDGWADNVHTAWPILQRHGARATIFIVRDWTAASRDSSRDRFIAPHEIRALTGEGLEFGAHSVSHPRLSELSEQEIRRELELSKQAVSDWSGRACRTLAYPYGDHDDRVCAIAETLFDAAVVVGGGWWRPGDDLARIPRLAIHEDMSSTEPLFHDRITFPLRRLR